MRIPPVCPPATAASLSLNSTIDRKPIYGNPSSTPPGPMQSSPIHAPSIYYDPKYSN